MQRRGGVALAGIPWLAHWTWSDTLLDVTGLNHLSPVGGPTYDVTGKLGHALILAAASSQAATHVSNSVLATGHVDWTFTAWVKLASKPAAQMTIIGKRDAVADEYALAWINTVDRFSFSVWGAGGVGVGGVTANSFGAPAIGVWTFVVVSYSALNNMLYISVNAGPVDSAALTGTALASTAEFDIGRIATSAGIRYWDGEFDDVCFAKSAAGGGGVLNAAQIAALYNGGAGTQALVPFSGLFALGDSKTAGDTWVPLLVTALEGRLGAGWSEQPGRFGIPGATVLILRDYVNTNLPAEFAAAAVALINIGANDEPSLPLDTDWRAELTSIIDSLRARSPSILVYVARPWRRGYAANCDTLAGWVATVVGTYGAGVFLGMDERVWLENGDDGNTYTVDGIHYNDAGESVAAHMWLKAMGY
jgi:lysophospholipase L1-like esterase